VVASLTREHPVRILTAPEKECAKEGCEVREEAAMQA